MEGNNFNQVLQGHTWLPKKEKTSSTLAQAGIIVEKTLGEGAYAKVKSAYYEKLKKKVAVKIISKQKSPKDFLDKFLHREIAMMAELDHSNIIQLLGVFESEDKIFLVLELADGGDLLEHVNQQRYTSEEEIRKHFLQLASAMAYSHQMGVVHRDLKLENIVLDQNSNLKITDYGFARQSVKGSNMETHCGSFAYACPSILRGEPYDGFAADVWSMGIILYTLLTYRLPYSDVELKILAKGSKSKKLKFTKDTPHAARDLVRRLLDPVDETRITCQQILNHDWVRHGNLATNKNKQETDNFPAATEFTQMENETSGSSITSSLSMQGPIPRNNLDNDVTDSENDQEGDKQFQMISVRRSTITSANNQRILSNVVKSNQTNFVNTVRKKRVALMCLGGLGKKNKKDKIEEEKDVISGTIKYKDTSGKKASTLGDVVTQLVKSKKAREQKVNKGQVQQDKKEMEGSDDDESIEQMRRELDCLSQEDSSAAITTTKCESRKSSLAKGKKESPPRMGKWKKVCNRMNK